MALSSIQSELGDSSGDDNLEDNDLTNLQWLSSTNLLQNMQVCNIKTEAPDLTEDNENVQPANEEVVTADVDDPVNKNVTSVPPVYYDPITHRNAKPPYSFSSLIFMAIESAPNKALPVKDIYQWIVDNYPYYQSAPAGMIASLVLQCLIVFGVAQAGRIPYATTWVWTSAFESWTNQAMT